MVIRSEVRNWLIEAEADLRRCKRCLEVNDYALSCYLAQQSIEKGLKALIMQLKHEIPRTHDLVKLHNEVKGTIALSADELAELSVVSQYYVTARYPNAGVETPSLSFTEVQARRAYELARKICEFVKREIEGHDC